MNRRELLKTTAIMGAALGFTGCGGQTDNFLITPAQAQTPETANFHRIPLEPDIADTVGPIATSSVFGPVPFLGSDGKNHLAYEIVVSNRSPRPIRLDLFEVLDDSERTRSLLRAENDKISTMMTLLAGGPDIRELSSSQVGIIYVDIALSLNESIPDILVHRFGGQDLGTNEPLPEVLGARTKVRADIRPPVFAPPATGENWVSAEACCNRSHHRRGPFTLGGEYYLAQRFAIDFIQLDPNGLAFVGDPSDNNNWFVYGKELRAVADGVVVETLNTEPDITPYQPVPNPLTKQTAGGNHVVVDMGNGMAYVFGHMQPGSVRVNVGDRVSTGQVLGLVGNSGNTSAPHLHMHLVSGTDIFQGRGLPYTFNHFVLTGSFATLDDFLPDIPGPPVNRIHETPRDVQNAYPLELQIVNF